MRAMNAILVGLVAGLVGCAHAPMVIEDPMTRAPGKPDTSKKLLTAREYAASFANDAECESAAEQVSRSSVDNGYALLTACIERGNFTLLEVLLSPPWVGRLRNDPQAPALVGRVIAARGYDLDDDIRRANGAGVNVLSLEDGITDPDASKGGLVVFRGQATALNGGSATISELGASDTDLEVEGTGRTIKAQVEKGGAVKVRRGRDSVFVARFDSVQQKEGRGGVEEEPSAVVTLMGAYETRLRERR